MFWRYAWLGFPLAFLGLPLYLYLPKFYVDTYAIDLSTLGFILLILRLTDMVADPLIGHLFDKFPQKRRRASWIAGGIAVLSYLALYLPLASGVSVPIYFAACTLALYVAYSVLNVQLYGAGVALAQDGAERTRLSARREGMILLGTLAASILPALLQPAVGNRQSLLILAILFAISLLVALFIFPNSHRLQIGPESNQLRTSMRQLLRDQPKLKWLFILFFVNALPVAMTSTLFQFFVYDRLQRPTQSAYYLVLYFLLALASTPVWSAVGNKWGQRRALAAGMALAVLSFVFASQLTPANANWFYLICGMSGFALGADMVLLPAMMSEQLSQRQEHSGISFAIWQALAKLSLAVAAGVCLPFLQYAGYRSGQLVDPQGLQALTLSYAVVPCVIKLMAMGILLLSPLGQPERKDAL